MRSGLVGPVGLRLSGELVGDLAVLAEHPYGLPVLELDDADSIKIDRVGAESRRRPG